MQLWILGVLLLISHAEPSTKRTCVTGYMTDVQNWVDEEGVLTHTIDYNNAIDLSSQINPVPVLHHKMNIFRSSSNRSVRYLSMAKCWLNRVPPIFQATEPYGRWLSQTVEYMTFFGNIFVDVDQPGESYYITMNATDAVEMDVESPFNPDQTTSVWSAGFQSTTFPKLLELDLRACSIRILNNNNFRSMPTLEALYLGENLIHFVEADVFANLRSLVHLDFSRNEAYDQYGNHRTLEMPMSVFEKLHNLISLDLSFTRLTQRNVGALRGLSKKLLRLSICNTGLSFLRNGIFSDTSLRIIDISDNNGILSESGIFRGLETSLQVVYAKRVGLQNIDVFRGLRNLEILQVANNEIASVPQRSARTWGNMQILDLNKNRLTSWFQTTFALMPNLRFLSIRDNNINVISEDIIKDLSHLDYLAMSGNFIVCNCYARDFYELAAMNEQRYENTTLLPYTGDSFERYQFHNAYSYFREVVFNREKLVSDCEDCANELKVDGNFILTDYSPSNYMCHSVTSRHTLAFDEVTSCHNMRDIDYDGVMAGGHYKLLALLVLPCILLPMFILFILRRNLRYCLITMRNSAMLSLINKKEVVDDGTIFHYDVFVSYCNEDRAWVLDHLLPHLESNCSISACLHERDFQVGLSILENIVSCMDRSRSIMLIISQRFLLSQWCQFEMHLAQHRLLETRREDLTLVLLEEIPRRLRPTTLHFLMLTKTYIVWPDSDSERALFWKRLRKSLMTNRLKQREGVSIA